MAKEFCGTCGAEIHNGRLLSDPNMRLNPAEVQLINFYSGEDYAELCQKCGNELHSKAVREIKHQRNITRERLETVLLDFPMMTIGALPTATRYHVVGLVTANISVGTGIFNEFSQGISDLFGAVNSETGMAFKVNRGEAAARMIISQKAIQMGANCIIGVDVDYGVTGNNAATVNMQGTAIKLDDLTSVLSPDLCSNAEQIARAVSRLADINRWLNLEFVDGEIYSNP